MKFQALLVLIGLGISNVASAEEIPPFSGGFHTGSIENVSCSGSYDGDVYEMVSVVSSKRNAHGYVNALVLKITWLDENNKERWAPFTVRHIDSNEDTNVLRLVGISPQGNKFDMSIDVSGAYGGTELKINNEAIRASKLQCKVSRAG